MDATTTHHPVVCGAGKRSAPEGGKLRERQLAQVEAIMGSRGQAGQSAFSYMGLDPKHGADKQVRITVG